MEALQTAKSAARAYVDLPGPKRTPLLGNALQLKHAPFHLQMEAWAREFGPTFRYEIAGRRFVVLTQPDQILSVLRQRPDVFLKGPRLVQVAKDLGFHGVFTADGDAWQRQRKMVLAGLDPAHLRAFLPGIVEVTGSLRDRWLEAGRAQSGIDLLADLMRYTVDVTTGLAFGHNLDTLHTGDQHLIQQHLNVIFPTIVRRSFAPFDFEKWLPRKDVVRHAAALRTAVLEFIQRARDEIASEPQLAIRPRNLLQALIAARDGDESWLSDEDLAGNVLLMLIAGEDTTANTIAWLTWLLHANAEAWARARAEVDAVIGKGALPQSIEQLTRLDYLEACANESLRLKPVAPFVIVQAGRDVVIGDLLIPQGAFVTCDLRAAGLSPARFAEPQVFDPARWLPGGEAESASMMSAKRVVMPFSAGPRVCPGRYLALTEVKMVMAMLLSCFDVCELTAPGGEPKEVVTLVMSPLGLRMRVRARQSP